MNELTTMISDLGVPVAVTCASGALVYFLLNWVKSTLLIYCTGVQLRRDVLLRNFYINQLITGYGQKPHIREA